MLSIDRSLNAIWRVRRSRPYWLLVLGYATLLVAGPVLIGMSLSATTYLLSLPIGAAAAPGERHPLAYQLIPASMSAAAFFLTYVIVPHRRVPWRHALLGSIVAAALFESAKGLFGVYVHYVRTFHLIYGAFAAVPFFLVWIYLSWLVVLLGAELTASAAYWHGRLWARPPGPGARFREAVLVARALLAAGSAGEAFERIRRAVRLPVHEVEDTLGRMQAAGIARREGRSRYALAADASDVTLLQLYEATVGPVGGMPPAEWGEVSEDFAQAAARMREGLQRPLASLAPSEAAAESAPPALGR